MSVRQYAVWLQYVSTSVHQYAVLPKLYKPQQVADLMAHFYINTFDKAREAIFQEAIKAAKEEVESLI